MENLKRKFKVTNFWDASSDKMVDYIKSILPKDLKKLDRFDMFWYEDYPRIGWEDQETGKNLLVKYKNI